MRSGVNIAMFLSGIWTVLTGIIGLVSYNTESADHHVVAASIFTIALCIHVWLNRKPFFQRFKGLGWKWSLIGLGLFIIIITTVGHPR